VPVIVMGHDQAKRRLRAQEIVDEMGSHHFTWYGGAFVVVGVQLAQQVREGFVLQRREQGDSHAKEFRT